MTDYTPFYSAMSFFGIMSPARPICLIADCSEASVLRLRSLQPYVPLRRTPSESASAIRHVGLKVKEHNSEEGVFV